MQENSKQCLQVGITTLIYRCILVPLKESTALILVVSCCICEHVVDWIVRNNYSSTACNNIVPALYSKDNDIKKQQTKRALIEWVCCKVQAKAYLLSDDYLPGYIPPHGTSLKRILSLTKMQD